MWNICIFINDPDTTGWSNFALRTLEEPLQTRPRGTTIYDVDVDMIEDDFSDSGSEKELHAHFFSIAQNHAANDHNQTPNEPIHSRRPSARGWHIADHTATISLCALLFQQALLQS